MTRAAWWWPGGSRPKPGTVPVRGRDGGKSGQHDGPGRTSPDGRRPVSVPAPDPSATAATSTLWSLRRPTPSRSTRPASTTPSHVESCDQPGLNAEGTGHPGHPVALVTGVHVKLRSAVRELPDRDREARRQSEDGDGAVVGVRWVGRAWPIRTLPARTSPYGGWCPSRTDAIGRAHIPVRKVAPAGSGRAPPGPPPGCWCHHQAPTPVIPRPGW
jgi:hypothetical protein